MTLFWIEEGFVAEDQFDRLAGMPKPGAVVHILSTPRPIGEPVQKCTPKKGERMPDNWKHRSEGMRCKTCMFFVPKVPANDCIVAEEKACLGPGRMMTASEFSSRLTIWAVAAPCPHDVRVAGNVRKRLVRRPQKTTRTSYDHRLSRG